jgi:DNA-binding protein YbaB
MNIQTMVRQAQKLQEEIKKEKDLLDQKEFSKTKHFVTVKMTGNKRIKEIILDNKNTDIEMIEDVILITINNLMDEIDEETNNKLEKYTKGMTGLF